MLRTLDSIRNRRWVWTEGGFDVAGARRDYPEAFRSYGLTVGEGEPAALVGRIESAPISWRLVRGLDDWLLIEDDAARQAAIAGVLRAADPDEFRSAFRSALSAQNGKRLRQLAGGDLRRQPPAFVAVLGDVAAIAAERRQALLQEAWQRQPDDFVLAMELALTLEDRDRGQADLRVAWYRTALASRSDNYAAWNNLGNALREKGDLEGAVVAYRAALALAPKLATAHSNLGIALRAQGDLGGAAAAYRAALDLDPKLATAHFNLGIALKAQGDVDGAVTAYRKAIALGPKDAQAHYNLGNALRAQGDVDGAVAAYRKAIDCDPKFAKAHYNLGNALRAQRDLEGAVLAYRKAIGCDPKLARAHGNLGAALRAKGDLEGAVAAYRKATALNPKGAKAHNGLGISLNDLGRFQEAEVVYREAVRLEPNYPEAHCNLGHVLRRQGRFPEALAALRRGHELGRKTPGWRYPSADWARQCERLAELDRKLPAVLAGEAQPADAAEQLMLASLCEQPYKRLYAAAARFYRDAFAADPKLAGDMRRQHRYHAACAAARAAAGQGEGAKNLPDKVAAMFRRQALAWLRADLTAYAKLAEGGRAATKKAVRQRLEHWQKDRDLAGLRDRATLDKLPRQEQQAWRQLWAEVAALQRRVQEKK
jgi:tetratricopeptide (TPR) repeat protein